MDNITKVGSIIILFLIIKGNNYILRIKPAEFQIRNSEGLLENNHFYNYYSNN